MEGNKYFDELKRAFGFECYIGDVYHFRGKDIDYLSYISESVEGDPLYILKEPGSEMSIMTDVFTNQNRLVDAIKDILMDGDRILVDDHLAMWLDMDNGSFPSDFWEDFYKTAVAGNYIKSELV